MKQNVMITVRGTQQPYAQEAQSVELVTPGLMTGRNGKFAISYEETELTGNPGTTSTFLVFHPERVVLTRSGAVRSRMVFRKGVREESLYDVGVGSLLLGIRTRDIAVELDETGGRLFIDYIVEIEQNLITTNSYEIFVKPIP